MRQIIYAVLLAFLAAASASGQDAGPRLLSSGDSGIAPIKKSAVAIPRVAADLDGRVRGSSVVDRLGEIRRRAVDADISRPFSVTDETNPELIELHGALPAVPRRTVSTPFEKPVSTRKIAPKVDAFDFPTASPAPVAKVAPVVNAPAVKPQVVASQGTAPKVVKSPVVQSPVVESAVVESTVVKATPAQSTPVQVESKVVVAKPEPQPPVVITQPQLAEAQPEPQPEPQPTFLPALEDHSDPEPAFVDVPAAAPVAKPQAKPAPVLVATKEIKKASNVLLSNEVPALSFQTKGPKTIRIGREAQYRVTMLNNGDADARDVIVKVHLPVWAEVTRSNSTIGKPNVELDRDRSYVVTWELGQLPKQGHEDLMLGIVPRDGRPFDLSVGWTLAASQSTTQIQVQEPKLEMSINGANDVLYGETAIYTIVLSNPGTGDAEDVSLNLMPLTPRQDVAGTRKVGTIKAGERKTIELELTAHQAGNLQVRAIASAEGGLRADAAQDVVVRRANLDIAIIGPPRNYAGTDATYKVRIENTGDATAEQSSASAVIPPTARYIASNDGGKFDSSNNRIHWNVGSLRPGAVRVLEFRCVLEAAGDNRIDISSLADGDLQITKSVVTNVEALADLKLFVNDPKGPISTGQDSIYEVKIVNRGTKIAENISVVGYFSDGIEPVDVRGWRGSVSTGQVQFEPISSLSPGQELVFRITARAVQPGNHVFRAEVECNNPETRLALEEWTKYYAGAPASVASRPQQPRFNNVQQSGTGQAEFVLPDVRR